MADYTAVKNSSANFNTVKYTGNGGSQSITGVGHQPDWVWIKKRNGAADSSLMDVIRGVRKSLVSNANNAEYTESSGFSSFDSDGFSFDGNGFNHVNTNSDSFVGWCWKANGAGSSNSDGTISSTVSVNTTAGFSIVSYTGNGTTGATVGHGLGVKPNLIILKYRNVGSTNWQVYHSSLGATKYLQLNSNGASTTSNTRWNDVEPTNQVFTLGSSGDVKTNGGQYIAYCFAEKRGFSKFGAYSGFSNTNGPFLYTGFKPKYVCIKCTSTTDHFVVDDTARSPFNEANHTLYSNLSNAEYTAGAYGIDIVSNGIKIRNLDGNYSSNGRAYVWWAFADEPLVGDNPATAR
jgi:hypothetical protein